MAEASKCRNKIGRKCGFVKYDKILFEVSSLCNVRCVWCWMYNSKRKDMGLMSLDSFKKAVDLSADYLRKKRFPVILQHRGEALLHPHFFEMLHYARDKGATIGGIHTNLSVPLDMEKFMKSPLPSILVNMGGITREIHEKVMRGSNFQLVVDNLRAIFKEICRSRSNKEVFLKINPTKYNVTQLHETSRFFESLGGNPNNVKIGRTAFFLPQEASREEIRRFFFKHSLKGGRPLADV